MLADDSVVGIVVGDPVLPAVREGVALNAQKQPIKCMSTEIRLRASGTSRVF